MENFNEFLHANSSQTSLSCLLDSLENWKKSTLTFKDAIKAVELMAYHIENLAKKCKELESKLDKQEPMSTVESYEDLKIKMRNN